MSYILKYLPVLLIIALSSCYTYSPGDQQRLDQIPDLSQFPKNHMALVVTRVSDKDAVNNIENKSFFKLWKKTRKLIFTIAKAPKSYFLRESSNDEKLYAFHTLPIKQKEYRAYQIYPGKYHLIFPYESDIFSDYQMRKDTYFTVKTGEVVYLGDIDISYDYQTIDVEDKFNAAKNFLKNSVDPTLSDKLEKRLIK